MGSEIPAEKKLEQLISEGLTRHDAIHAIASGLANHFYKILHHTEPVSSDHHEYFAELNEISAASWLSME